MNAMHTPGPWVSRGTAVFRDGETAMSVALANQHKAECIANARLIAAAPDMLASLRELTAICSELAGELKPLEMASVREARAVIAKATGVSVPA